MRLVTVLCFMSVVSIAVSKADAPTLGDEMKKLEGTWRPTENIFDGASIPEEQLKAWRTVIKADTYENQREGQPDTKGTLKLVSRKDKHFEMDLRPAKGPGEGKVVKCIVELNGDDKFRLCMAEPDAERPTDFTSEKGSKRVLRTYAREKD